MPVVFDLYGEENPFVLCEYLRCLGMCSVVVSFCWMGCGVPCFCLSGCMEVSLLCKW